jgi:hypothetical protein
LAPEVRRILLIDAPSVLDAITTQQLEDELGAAVVGNALTVLKKNGALQTADLEALSHAINGALTGIALWAAHHQVPLVAIERGMATLEHWLSAC